MKRLSMAVLLMAGAFPALAQNQITGGSCSAQNLNGTYSLTLSGRSISSAGLFNGSYQAVGTATFDGSISVVLSGTSNTNLTAGAAFSYAGSYAVPTNCLGTITLLTGSSATFVLLVSGGGTGFTITGADGTYVYSGGGSNTRPACATATLSGGYAYTASGFTLSGTTQSGSVNEAGILQFDGQGNVTSSYIDSSSGAADTPVTGTGTYSVAANCLATAKLTDSNGNTDTLNLVITGAYGATANFIEASAAAMRSGSAHSTILNPTQSIGNVASYAVNGTPAGSVFALFGLNLASKDAQAGDSTATGLAAEYFGASEWRGGTVVLCFAGTNRCADAVGDCGRFGGVGGGENGEWLQQCSRGVCAGHGHAGHQRVQFQSRGGDQFGRQREFGYKPGERGRRSGGVVHRGRTGQCGCAFGDGRGVSGRVIVGYRHLRSDGQRGGGDD